MMAHEGFQKIAFLILNPKHQSKTKLILNGKINQT